MRGAIWHALIIVAISATVFFTNLGEARLWDRDEPRNAGCAAEMMAQGELVVPIFNDELRHQKPILLYWLMMSAYSVFGINEFSARFWSAVLAISTSVMTYIIARRLTSPRAALIAGIALATSLMFGVAARAATPDSTLIFCSTAALMFYVLGTFSNRSESERPLPTSSWFPDEWRFVVAMYSMMGLGVLAKGPVGFVLPMAMIGLFMLIQRLPNTEEGNEKQMSRLAAWTSLFQPFYPVHFVRTFWAMRPILATAVILLIAAPWYLAVDARTDGTFTNKFFVGENLGRATATMESHSGGLWFYPLVLLLGFFPWSVFWGPITVSLIGKRLELSSAARFSLCIIVVQVGAFSLAKTKLPSYVTPCYPALAILTGICLDELATQRSRISRGWFYAAMGGLALAGSGTAIGLALVASKQMPAQLWLSGLGLIPIIAAGWMILMLAKNKLEQIPEVFAISATLFCVGVFGFGTPSVDREQNNHVILKTLNDAPVDTKVVSFGQLEPSWVFYSGRPILELNMGPAHEIEKRQESIPAREFWQPKPRPRVEAFFDSNPTALVITSSDELSQIQERLPDDYDVIETADYFLKSKKLFLLGPRTLKVADDAESPRSGDRTR